MELLLDQEARLLARAGHEVVVLASDAGDGPRPTLPPRVRVCQVPAWNWPERRLQVPWPVFSPALLPAVTRHVRWCDVVHAHGLLYTGTVLSLLLARALGKPALLTEHIGLAWFPAGARRVVQWAATESVGRLSARLAGRCYGQHDRVVALLRWQCGPGGRVKYQRNPLDRVLFRPPRPGEREAARRELGWEPGRPKVLFVGRLIARKGMDLLLGARGPGYDLAFCGPGDAGPLRPHLGAGVEYLPPRPREELVRLYHAADVLALLSRSEGGLPLVAQEALACGLPVALAADPGLAAYGGCPGLAFCASPGDLPRVLHTLVVRGRLEPGPAGESGLDAFLPSASEWLAELYGDRTPGASSGAGSPLG
ncbi:glycosyltransferase family 4 protein [Gemmata sp. JC717]|uniref:glycosyltransferase family 4 protein n=1 Tax=Gemmata algarum TaxID=2975278 RepID=UPI0028E0A09B|nr:glycosyltransferase family 4 protein [Gemmata algarum]MDY3554885.1 glycosyltransferase family 4 protein [Gemmata algarum]